MVNENELLQEPECSSSNLLRVSICALRPRTIEVVSRLLNPRKIFLTAEKIPKDWRGLAHFLNVPGEYMPSYIKERDPTAAILSTWGKDIKVNQFLDFLKQLERWDIVDDVREMINEDVEIYNAPSNINSQPPLTVEMQSYDAFVLHADDDEYFASILLDKMHERGLKLCTKDDLNGGEFVHDAVMNLISKCKKVVVIVSPAFLESAENVFYAKYAQVMGIQQQTNKIIPCLYKECKVPPNIKIYHAVVYFRNSRVVDFWEKLQASILGIRISYKTSSSVNIRELDDTSNHTREIAGSLPNDIAPRNALPAIMESKTKDEKLICMVSSLPEIPSSLSDLGTASSLDLIPGSSEKSKRQKWFQKLSSKLNTTKKDKKKKLVAV